MPTLLYQSLAEPCLSTAQSKEAAQLDKWYVRTTDPARLLARTHNRDGLTDRVCEEAIDPKQLTLKEQVQADKFFTQPPPPPCPPPRVTTVLGWNVVDPKQLTLKERVQADKFYVQPPDPPRHAKWRTDVTATFMGPSPGFDVSSDFGWQAPAEPPRFARRRTDTDCSTDVFVTSAAAFNPAAGFPYPTPEPPPRPPRRELYGHSEPATTLGKFTAETTQPDKWYVRPADPSRPAPRLTDGGAGPQNFAQVFAAAFSPAAGFPYPAPEPPPRPLPRLPHGQPGSPLAGVGLIVPGFINFQGSSGGEVAAPGATLAVSLPANVTPDAVCVLTVICDRAASIFAGSFNPPAGWTAFGGTTGSNDGTNSISIRAYWALGSVANLTFTKSGVVDNAGWTCASYTGVDPLQPLDVVGTAAISQGVATVTAPALTPLVRGAWQLVCAGDYNRGDLSAPNFDDLQNASAVQSAAVFYWANDLPKRVAVPARTVTSSAPAAGQIMAALAFTLKPIGYFPDSSGFPWPADYSIAPPRRLADRDAGGQIFAAAFTTAFDPAAGFPWPGPEGPPRALPRLADRECLDLGEGVFNAETTTPDRWYVVPVPPPRPAPRLADRESGPQQFFANFVGVLNPGSGFPYLAPEPAPRQPQRVSSLQLTYGTDAKQFTLVERTQLDKWFNLHNPLPRPPPRLTDRDAGPEQFAANFAPALDPAAGFPYPTPEPPPRQPGRVSSLQPTYGIDAKQLTQRETTQLDKWYVRTVEPPRPPQRLTDRDAGGQIFWQVFVPPPPPAGMGIVPWPTRPRMLPVWGTGHPAAPSARVRGRGLVQAPPSEFRAPAAAVLARGLATAGHAHGPAALAAPAARLALRGRMTASLRRRLEAAAILAGADPLLMRLLMREDDEL